MSEEKKPVDMAETMRRLNALLAESKLLSVTSLRESNRRMAQLQESQEDARVAFDRSMERIKEMSRASDAKLAQMKHDEANDTRRIPVDKRTHSIRFESETEERVTIVIEKREADR